MVDFCRNGYILFTAAGEKTDMDWFIYAAFQIQIQNIYSHYHYPFSELIFHFIA